MKAKGKCSGNDKRTRGEEGAERRSPVSKQEGEGMKRRSRGRKTVQGQRRQASAQEGAKLVWKPLDRRKQRRR